MGQRVVRVNELLKREISHVLHTRFQQETVAVTITGVDVTPNLRKATVYYSIVEPDAAARVRIERFMRRNAALVGQFVGQSVVLKYLPRLEFALDEANERGSRLNELMDSLGLEGEADGQPEIEDFS